MQLYRSGDCTMDFIFSVLSQFAARQIFYNVSLHSFLSTPVFNIQNLETETADVFCTFGISTSYVILINEKILWDSST